MAEEALDYIYLNEFKAKLDRCRPIDAGLLQNLRENLILQWTYNSNAIEGNTLTLKETKVVLEGVTIGGKTLREHFEAINHRDAIEMVEMMVSESELLSERVVKELHQLILKNIDADNAGRYRQVNVTIAGVDHRPMESVAVPQAMSSFIEWYRAEGQVLHPVERAARVHVDFVGIHPFVDGNGRTSRLLMNLELMKSGFPAVVVPVEDRMAYYEALDEAHCDKNYLKFMELVAGWVEKSFEPYWWALGESSSS